MIRLAQVEEELSSALSKNGSLEKTKARLTGEVEDLQLDLERVSLNNYFSPAKSWISFFRFGNIHFRQFEPNQMNSIPPKYYYKLTDMNFELFNMLTRKFVLILMPSLTFRLSLFLHSPTSCAPHSRRSSATSTRTFPSGRKSASLWLSSLTCPSARPVHTAPSSSRSRTPTRKALRSSSTSAVTTNPFRVSVVALKLYFNS